ncbi:MAG: hypothetical protein WDO24_30360 [Pseudomonadota bacterium]
MLGDSAKGYGFTLRPAPLRAEGFDAVGYAGADPSDFFTPDALIDDRLYLTAFRRLPAVLILISTATLAFDCAGCTPPTATAPPWGRWRRMGRRC